jgi:hypothetical protein
VDVKIRRHLERFVEQGEIDNAIDPERSIRLTQMAISDDIPPAPAMHQRTGIEFAVGGFRPVVGPIGELHPTAFACSPAQFFQDRRHHSLIAAMQAGGD